MATPRSDKENSSSKEATEVISETTQHTSPSARCARQPPPARQGRESIDIAESRVIQAANPGTSVNDDWWMMSGAVGSLASASASAGAGASASAAAGAAMASAPAGAVGGMSANYLNVLYASPTTRSLLAIASLQSAAFLLRVLTQGAHTNGPHGAINGAHPEHNLATPVLASPDASLKIKLDCGEFHTPHILAATALASPAACPKTNVHRSEFNAPDVSPSLPSSTTHATCGALALPTLSCEKPPSTLPFDATGTNIADLRRILPPISTPINADIDPHMMEIRGTPLVPAASPAHSEDQPQTPLTKERPHQFQLVVHICHHDQPICLTLHRDASVDELLEALHARGGPSTCALQFAGKVLRPGVKLAEYGVVSESILRELPDLRGGMIQALLCHCASCCPGVPGRIPPSGSASAPLLSQAETPETDPTTGGGTHTQWTAESWISSLPIQRALANALLQRASQGQPNGGSEADAIKSLDRKAVRSVISAAVSELAEVIAVGLEELQKTPEVDASKLNDKFQTQRTGFVFDYGDMSDYHAGLEGRIGLPNPKVWEQMVFEHLGAGLDCPIPKSGSRWLEGKSNGYSDIEFNYEAKVNKKVQYRTSTACKQFNHVLQPAVGTSDGHESGQAGWTLENFMDWNSEGCVQLQALVKVKQYALERQHEGGVDSGGERGIKEGRGAVGTLLSVLTDEKQTGTLQKDRKYRVRVNGEQQQYTGAELHVMNDDGRNAKQWLQLHGEIAKLRYKPVRVNPHTKSSSRGILLEDVPFEDGKLELGLKFEEGAKYKVRLASGLDREFEGSTIEYCVDVIDFQATVEVTLHQSDPTPILVSGRHVAWHDAVFRANLTKEEVVGLRLYTGPMFVWYNEVLRNIHTPREKVRAELTHVVKWKEIASEDGKVDGHIPFATTIHVLNSAIIKLSRAQRAERVYRGTQGGRLPGKFWTPNRDNIRGGIEKAFMSTTMNRSVAMDFASGESEAPGKHQPSVVFEMQMGMIDRGAAVQCFSQFPGEAEILFAPLTGLEVAGRPRVEGRSIVVEIRLNTNLHDLTIEQVIAKMKKTHTDLLHTIEMDMTMNGFTPHALIPLENHKSEYEKKDGSWFNNSDNYKAATNAALDAKLNVCGEVLQSDAALEKEREKAVDMLFNPNDGAALAKGIAVLLTHPRLLEKYKSKLDRISGSASLARLDLEGLGLKCELPRAVIQTMATAEYFNLSGNTFINVENGTALYDMVYRMNNWNKRTVIQWSSQNGGGKFAAIPEEMFVFKSLVELDLMGNYIAGLPDTIGDLKSLQDLNLEFCKKLKALPETLYQLPLKKFSIRRCKKLPLDTVDHVCKYFTQLDSLDLGGLEITGLPDTIGDLKNLQKLNMSGCSKLEGLPVTIGDLKNLQDLNLAGCAALTGLPETFYQLPLKKLNIKYCKKLPLDTVDHVCERLTQLEELALGGLEITGLPKMDGCASLLDVNLESCEALTADGLREFCAHPPLTLQKLNLSRTNLEGLPDTIGKLEKLQNLNLAHCYELKGLPDTIGDLKNLQDLNLYGCEKLEGLPDTIGDLQNLQNLYLVNCQKLEGLPVTIGDLKNLQNLNLGRCEALIVDRAKLQAQLPNCNISF